MFTCVFFFKNWGGKENGFGLADCCLEDLPIPHSATTLHVEFHREFEDSKDGAKSGKNSSNVIHIEHVDKIHKTPAEIMKSLLGIYYVPPDKQVFKYIFLPVSSRYFILACCCFTIFQSILIYYFFGKKR